MLELMMKFIELRNGILDDRNIYESFCTQAKFELRFQVLAPVEFLEFEIDALIIVKAVRECMIICPQCFCMSGRHSTNNFPLLLKVFESVELIGCVRCIK